MTKSASLKQLAVLPVPPCLQWYQLLAACSSTALVWAHGAQCQIDEMQKFKLIARPV